MDEFSECDGFNPLDEDGEQAAVSVLVAAAARAGFTPVSECRVEKAEAQRNSCRGDLWFNFENSAYAFEFKHWRGWKDGISDLADTLESARREAERVVKKDCWDRLYAGLIAPIRGASYDDCWRFGETVDLAFVVEKPADPTFFFFKDMS